MDQQCFLWLKNQKKLLLNFRKILSISYKNGNAKDCKFVKQFWEWIFKICYVIDSETKGSYSHHDPIEFTTKSIEPSLCDYSDAYILVTGDITVTGGNANTKVAFVHHLRNVGQKWMILMLMKQILLILQCLCKLDWIQW